MKTVAGIAAGYADNLLLRSADVLSKGGQEGGYRTARNAFEQVASA